MIAAMLRLLPRWLGLVVLLAALPSRALAQESAAAPTPPTSTRVVVLLLATGNVAESAADDLSEVLIGAVAERGGVAIVGKEEFQARLGGGERGSLECVSSAACLGRIGVELSVDQVISGTIGQRDGTWAFNLNRVDVRSGDLLGRVFREVSGDLGAVAGELQDALPALYAVVRRPATILVSSNVEGAEVAIDGLVIGSYQGDAPVRLEGVAAGQHEVRVRAPGHRSYVRAVHVASGATLQLEAELGSPGASPLVWIGAGLVVAGGGSAAAFGVLSQASTGAGSTRQEAIDAYAQRDTEALLANLGFAVLGAGAITLGIGVLLSLLSSGGGGDGDEDDFAPDETAHLGVAPLAGGAAMTLGGSF
jgi:hypothetical protein